MQWSYRKFASHNTKRTYDFHNRAFFIQMLLHLRKSSYTCMIMSLLQMFHLKVQDVILITLMLELLYIMLFEVSLSSEKQSLSLVDQTEKIQVLYFLSIARIQVTRTTISWSDNLEDYWFVHNGQNKWQPHSRNKVDVYHGIFRTNCSSSERSTLICLSIY